MGKADTVTKSYMRKNSIFADAFNYLIYNGEKRILPEQLRELDPTELAILPNTVHGKSVFKTKNRYRDLLKSAVIMEDQKAAYVILGVENQTDIHYAMPVRNMIYDALQYGRQVDTITAQHRQDLQKSKATGEAAEKLHGAEYISGFSKQDKILPVITLVVHFGAEEWDGPTSLKEMFEEYDEPLMDFIQDYKIHLIDPAKLSDEALKNFHTSLGYVLGYMKHSKTKKELQTYLMANDMMALDIDVIQVLQALTGLQVDVKEDEDKVELCGALKEWSEDERREGRAEGRTEGILEGRLHSLHSHILMCLSTKGDVSADLKGKIETETDPELLDRWFTCALSCAGPEDFLERISSNSDGIYSEV